MNELRKSLIYKSDISSYVSQWRDLEGKTTAAQRGGFKDFPTREIESFKNSLNALSKEDLKAMGTQLGTPIYGSSKTEMIKWVMGKLVRPYQAYSANNI